VLGSVWGRLEHPASRAQRLANTRINRQFDLPFSPAFRRLVVDSMPPLYQIFNESLCILVYGA
jgi:hypothetical protein